jgi:hypothetical protein
VSECDCVASIMRRPWPTRGCRAGVVREADVLKADKLKSCVRRTVLNTVLQADSETGPFLSAT